LTAGGVDWGVGVEGGLSRVGDRWFSGVWCVIRAGEEESLGGGVHFELPPAVCRGILEEDREMGDCMDELTGLKMTKRKMGAEGILTGGRIDRLRTFQNAVIYALAPHLCPSYYEPAP
jgi:inosine/xanthosine triphosphatase